MFQEAEELLISITNSVIEIISKYKDYSLNGNNHCGVDNSEVDNSGIDNNSVLATLELESIHILQISSEISELYNTKIPISYFVENHTINDISSKIFNIINSERKLPTPNDLDNTSFDEHSPFPLNDVQQSFWLGKESVFPLGNIPPLFFVEFEVENLNLNKLQSSWQSLIDRHDMLRAIILQNGQQQILQAPPSYEIINSDISQRDNIEESILLERKEFIAEVCNSEEWPLFGLKSYKVSDNRSRLFLKIDLLIADVLSCRILLHELSSLYYGNPLSNLDSKGLFKKYIINEIQRNKTDTYNDSFTYWRDRVETLPFPPQLPTQKSPKEIKKPFFSRLSKALSPERWGILKSLASDLNVSSSMLLCSIFSEILTCWTSEKRFTLNILLYKRDSIDEDIYKVIGDFTSNLLLEIDFSERRSIKENAKKVQKQLWKDIEHSDVSGIRVIRELHHHHNDKLLTMPILFSSNIGIESFESNASYTSDKMLGTPIFSTMQLPQVWLNHTIIEEKGHLVFSWDFVEDIFPENLISVMFESYCTLLDKIIDNNSSLSELLPIEEIHNHSIPKHVEIEESKKHFSLKNRIFDNCKNLKEQTALITSNNKYSYEEILIYTNTLIALFESEVSSTKNIAIICNNPAIQAASMLACIFSNIGFSTIHPNWPSKRINHTISYCNVDLAITDIPSIDIGKTPALKINEEFITNSSNEIEIKLEPSSSENNQLFYNYCNSPFSTNPYQVYISEHNLADNFSFISSDLALQENDTLLSISDYCSDVYTFDLLYSLYSGSTFLNTFTSADCDIKRVTQIKCDDIHQLFSIANKIESKQIAIGNKISYDLEKICSRIPGRDLIITDNIIGTPIITGYSKVSATDHLYIKNPDISPISLDAEMTFRPPISVGYIFHTGSAVPRYNPVKTPSNDKEEKIINEDNASKPVNLFPTNRLGLILESGEVRYLRENNEIIQIDCVRTNIEEISSLLESHPAISETAIIYDIASNEKNEITAYISSILDLARVPLSVPCIVEDDFGRKYRTETVNISGNSISIKSNTYNWHMNQQVWVKLNLEGINKNKRLPGHIKWYSSEIANISLEISTEQFALIQKSLNTIFSRSIAGANSSITLQEAFDSRIRAPYYEPCLIKLPRHTSLIEANTHNISNNGIMVSGINVRCIPDQKLKLCIFLPNHPDALWINGSVVWQSGPDMGIKFSLDDNDSSIISKAVNTIIRTENQKFSQFSISDVKDYLSKYLPRQSIPSRFILLDNIPRKNNNEINYEELPSPDEGYYPEDSTIYQAPQSDIEIKIITLFEKTLNIKKAGVHDDFFEWGGDSYKALKFANILSNTIDKKVSMSQIYKYPTVAGLIDELNKEEEQ